MLGWTAAMEPAPWTNLPRGEDDVSESCEDWARGHEERVGDVVVDGDNGDELPEDAENGAECT